MKSPFPGMDPYIEARGLWEDFHPRLIAQISDALGAALPGNYVARIGQREYVVVAYSEGSDEHPVQPDVRVPTPTPLETAEGSPVAADNEPITMRAFIATEHKENFIEIYALEPERQLVTCLEVLSPSNKRRGSEGWDLYHRKRQGLLLGAANLIEIDLLRGGTRMPMLAPWPNSPYTLLVARRERAPYCRAWPASFQRQLPVIPVPLVRPDLDLSLDLQPLIETIYERSRYANDIDYAKPLAPPLTADESAWLAEQLRARQQQS